MSMQTVRLDSLIERMTQDLEWFKRNSHLLDTWHVNYHYFCSHDNYSMLTFPSAYPDSPPYRDTIAKDCHDLTVLISHIDKCELIIAEEKLKEEKEKKLKRVEDLQAALLAAKLELLEDN